MTKAEILKNLKESGEIHRKVKTPYWEAAFELYWTTTGDKSPKMGCGACYNTVLQWLKQ